MVVLRWWLQHRRLGQARRDAHWPAGRRPAPGDDGARNRIHYRQRQSAIRTPKPHRRPARSGTAFLITIDCLYERAQPRWPRPFFVGDLELYGSFAGSREKATKEAWAGHSRRSSIGIDAFRDYKSPKTTVAVLSTFFGKGQGLSPVTLTRQNRTVYSRWWLPRSPKSDVRINAKRKESMLLSSTKGGWWPESAYKGPRLRKSTPIHKRRRLHPSFATFVAHIDHTDVPSELDSRAEVNRAVTEYRRRDITSRWLRFGWE